MGRSIPNNVIPNQDESGCCLSRDVHSARHSRPKLGRSRAKKATALLYVFTGPLPSPRYAQVDLLLPGLYGITGNVIEMAVAAGVQTGWPQPLLLTPIINPVCVTMSYTILSGRVASVFTPAGT